MTPTDRVREALENIRNERLKDYPAEHGPWILPPFLEREIRRLDETISLLDGHVLVKGWQPIETAPRDGTHFLAAQVPGSKGVFKTFWIAEVLPNGTRTDIGFFCFDGNDTYPIEPTHWMPLPDAPYVGRE